MSSPIFRLNSRFALKLVQCRCRRERCHKLLEAVVEILPDKLQSLLFSQILNTLPSNKDSSFFLAIRPRFKQQPGCGTPRHCEESQEACPGVRPMHEDEEGSRAWETNAKRNVKG